MRLEPTSTEGFGGREETVAVKRSLHAGSWFGSSLGQRVRFAGAPSAAAARKARQPNRYWPLSL